MSLKIGVVLSGCGVYDGSEIHEATLTLLHLAKQGAEVSCFAPNGQQHHVINHLNGEENTTETRDIRTESARIARSNVYDIAAASPHDHDALIFPGGFGAAKNLSNLAFIQSANELKVNTDISQIINAFYDARKPLGFMCIAPASVAAPALRNKGIKLTIGTDSKTAATIEACGHTHIPCAATDLVVDTTHRITTTPAYMSAANIAEADQGIAKLVAEICTQAQQLKAAA